MHLLVATTLLIIVTAALLREVPAEDDTKTVYFSLIYSGGENGYRSAGAIPAIHIAL